MAGPRAPSEEQPWQSGDLDLGGLPNLNPPRRSIAATQDRALGVQGWGPLETNREGRGPAIPRGEAPLTRRRASIDSSASLVFPAMKPEGARGPGFAHTCKRASQPHPFGGSIRSQSHEPLTRRRLRSST